MAVFVLLGISICRRIKKTFPALTFLLLEYPSIKNMNWMVRVATNEPLEKSWLRSRLHPDPALEMQPSGGLGPGGPVWFLPRPGLSFPGPIGSPLPAHLSPSPALSTPLKLPRDTLVPLARISRFPLPFSSNPQFKLPEHLMLPFSNA